jgi:hypothetical protein
MLLLLGLIWRRRVSFEDQREEWEQEIIEMD